jgi:hypothetical protein
MKTLEVPTKDGNKKAVNGIQTVRFFVHRKIDKGGFWDWKITHYKTGRAMPHFFKTRAEALTIARELDAITEFDSLPVDIPMEGLQTTDYQNLVAKVRAVYDATKLKIETGRPWARPGVMRQLMRSNEREEPNNMKKSVYDRLREAEHSPAWDRAGAYAIMQGDKYAGKLLCKYPVDGMGPLTVFLWDWTDPKGSREIQIGRASGCGYDKLAAAVDGLKFGKLVLSDYPKDWKEQLREAGYTLLNVL